MKGTNKSLVEHLTTVLDFIKVLDKEVRSKNLQNEQWFLDWQDELNSISVK